MIYFGTRERMIWVKAPATGTPLSAESWTNSGQDLNGGGYVLNSEASHKNYEFTWGASPADEVYAITDYFSGAYGTGPLYFIDPFAQKRNLFNDPFSIPFKMIQMGLLKGLQYSGAPSGLTGPVTFARLDAGETSPAKHFIPVPAGYTLHVAYIATGAVLYNGLTALTRTDPTATSLVWNTFTSSAEFHYQNTTGGSVDLWAARAVLLKNGESPTGGWEPGKGNSGVRFNGAPQVSGIMATRYDGMVSGSAAFKEVGMWEQGLA